MQTFLKKDAESVTELVKFLGRGSIESFLLLGVHVADLQLGDFGFLSEGKKWVQKRLFAPWEAPF